MLCPGSWRASPASLRSRYFHTHLTSHLSSLQVAVSAYFFSMFGITVYMISDSVISRLAASHSHCYLQVVSYVRERPQKVSITPDIEQSLEYPTITICSPAFFSKTRLVEGGSRNTNIVNFTNNSDLQPSDWMMRRTILPTI